MVKRNSPKTIFLISRPSKAGAWVTIGADKQALWAKTTAAIIQNRIVIRKTDKRLELLWVADRLKVMTHEDSRLMAEAISLSLFWTHGRTNKHAVRAMLVATRKRWKRVVWPLLKKER